MIDPKYKTRLKGEYNKSITTCPECGYDLSPHNRRYNIYTECVGFAESDIGMQMIVECPSCFTHWRFHAREGELSSMYGVFEEFVKKGLNHHFKP